MKKKQCKYAMKHRPSYCGTPFILTGNKKKMPKKYCKNCSFRVIEN